MSPTYFLELGKLFEVLIIVLCNEQRGNDGVRLKNKLGPFGRELKVIQLSYTMLESFILTLSKIFEKKLTSPSL